jgi:regulator of RNase E activity RraB
LRKIITFKRNEFSLHIGRVDKADYESVDNYLLYLWELANNYNGSYDGWGCTIEKE